MRISFFGKGGSGKTTIASSFIKYAQKLKDKKIIAIDGDVNTHLGKVLEMDQVFLGDRIDEIGEFFEKTRMERVNNYLKEKENMNVNEELIIIGTTPPDYDSKFIIPNDDDEFLMKFATKKGNTHLLTVGSYTDEGIGSQCYHSKLGSSELIYNRLLDDENTIVVTDGTAGVDSVGTSIFAVSDINIFVVEPTIKSIDVFLKFEEITKEYKLNNYVIVNKAYDDEDKQYVKSFIDSKKIIGFVPFSREMKRFEQGDLEAMNSFSDQMKEINEKIIEKALDHNKNWDEYYELMANIYTKNCEEWYSGYYGIDLTKYINPEFDYKKVIYNCKIK